MAVATTVNPGFEGALAGEPARGAWLRRGLRGALRLPLGVWAVLDFAALACCAWQALQLNPISFTKFGPAGAWAMALSAGGAQVLAAFALDLYSARNIRHWSRCIPRAVGCVLLAVAVPLAIGYFWYYEVPGRKIALALMGSGLAAVVLLRAPGLLLRSHLKSRILFIGAASEVEHLRRLLYASGPHAYELVAVVDAEHPAADPDGTPPEESIARLCAARQIDEIVLSASRQHVVRWFERAVRAVRHGCKLTALPDLLEAESGEVPVEMIDAPWLLGEGWDLRNHLSELVKRGADLALGLIGLLLCVPLYLLLGLLIRLTSQGPVFYSQVRVGRFGAPFRIWKFRSMRVDAEQDGAQWAREGDTRVEWYGRLLRKSRLDETPQFLNILLGQMSFVGPRPERPEFVAELVPQIPFYACRHLVRPGLTGWAQVNYGYGASVEDAQRKLQFDLYYVRHLSLTLDFRIILRTFAAIARGAR